MIALPMNRSARREPQPAPLERGGTHLDGDRPRRAPGTASPSPHPTVDSSSFKAPSGSTNERQIGPTEVTRTDAQSYFSTQTPRPIWQPRSPRTQRCGQRATANSKTASLGWPQSHLHSSVLFRGLPPTPTDATTPCSPVVASGHPDGQIASRNQLAAVLHPHPGGDRERGAADQLPPLPPRQLAIQTCRLPGLSSWPGQDSNLRATDYESAALTN